MKNISLNLILAILAAVSISSCRNDMEINAPYKDIMVVYGLMNQSNDTQFVKIYKAFLGEGDAYVMAKNPDSIYYAANELEVFIQRSYKGVVKETYPLTRDTISNLPSGTFASAPNVVYYTTTNGSLDNNNSQLLSERELSDYKLIIYNKKSNDTITGETKLVTGFKPGPQVTQPTSNFTFAIDIGKYAEQLVKMNIEGTDDEDREPGRLYQVELRFNYMENGAPKSFQWVVDRITRDKETELNAKILGESFYKKVAENVIGNAPRQFVSLDIIFTIAAEDFNTYLEVNSPVTSSLLQDKPSYTNITNGYGIFSSRFTQVVTGKQLGNVSMLELKNGQYTGALGFQ